MDRGLRTKLDIVEALFSFADEIAFEKVSVSQVCLRAQVARQTFYAHFKDKYDAASWYVLSHVRQLASELGVERDWRSFYLADFEFVEENSDKIRWMSRTLDYNSLTNHAARTSREDFTTAYMRRCGCPPSELIVFQIERFSMLSSATTYAWVEGGCIPTAKAFVDLFITLIPRELYEALSDLEADN